MPTTETCGNSWPRTTSILSRAASSANFAEITLKLLFGGKAQRLFARGRQRRPLARQHQPSRRMADGADIFGPAYLERALLGDQSALGLRQRGFGLRHVGASDFADAETVLGRLELFAQHLDVVAIDLDKAWSRTTSR